MKGSPSKLQETPQRKYFFFLIYCGFMFFDLFSRFRGASRRGRLTEKEEDDEIMKETLQDESAPVMTTVTTTPSCTHLLVHFSQNL